LSLNEKNTFYEYSHVKEASGSDLINHFSTRLKSLNYSNVEVSENKISATGFTNHLVGGFATVEIHYKIKITFKVDRYKLTLTNFILTDKNGSNPIEGLGMFKKKWVKIINKKLPKIVASIESENNTEDW